MSALAEMLGPTWTRQLVWYWLYAAEIDVERLPNGYGVIPASQLGEVLYKLRDARAHRQHDGNGGGEARARRIRQGGVY